jgi:hypothetical protein
MEESVRDQVINATIAAIDTDPTHIESTHAQSTDTDSGGNTAVVRNDGQDNIDSVPHGQDAGEATVIIPLGEATGIIPSGEAEHFVDTQSVNFDVPSPIPRKNPLDASPMLEEPPLFIRRSKRNVNKPARFCTMLAQATIASICATPYSTMAFTATHDHMVTPIPIPKTEMNDNAYWYVDNTPKNCTKSLQHQEYVRMCDQIYDQSYDAADHREWTPLRMLQHRIRK